MNFDHPYQPPSRAQLEIPSEFTEPSVKAWLSELPIVDPDRAGDILLHGLRVLGRTAGLSARARAAQLESLRATLETLLAEGLADPPQNDESFPLQEPQEHRSHRAYCLCVELAAAYQAIALDADQAAQLGAVTGLQACVLCRALEGYGRGLLLLLENYEPAPPQLWKTIYDLYGEAVHQQLDHELISGRESGDTIFAQFMRIVLMSLANLQRYRPREIRQIYAVLGTLADKAELCDIPVRDNQKAQFYLDLAVDAPPQAILSMKGEGSIERRFVMTQLLVKWAAKFFAEAENRKLEGSRIPKSLLSSLLKSLTAPERRKTRRFPETGKHLIHIGLTAVAAQLAGPSTDPLSLASQDHAVVDGAHWLKIPHYTLETVRSEEESRLGIDNKVLRDDRQVDWRSDKAKSTMGRDEIWAQQNRGTDSPFNHAPRLDVWMLNSSAQGYCLLWTDKAISGARVGELIGVDGEGAALHLGVIRWLNHNEAGDLMLGLELISPDAEAGQAWVSSKPAIRPKALYICANPRLKQPAMVLVPPGNFDTGLVIEWGNATATRILKLDYVQSSTPAFVCYAVSAATRGRLTTAVSA